MWDIQLRMTSKLTLNMANITISCTSASSINGKLQIKPGNAFEGGGGEGVGRRGGLDGINNNDLRGGG